MNSVIAKKLSDYLSNLKKKTKSLSKRVKALDTGYLSEYGTRLETQTEAR